MEGCLKAVDRQPSFRGFRKSQGPKEQAGWLLKVWLCKEHNPTAQRNVNDRPLALPPPPPSLRDLEASGLSRAKGLAEKSKCTKCSQAIRSDTNPVRCDQCAGATHGHTEWCGGQTKKILAGGQVALEIFFKRSSHTIAGFYVGSDNDMSNLAAGNHFGGDWRCETK